MSEVEESLAEGQRNLQWWSSASKALLMQQRHYVVYILCSYKRALYIGMTSNLARRIYEHKNKLIKGFTSAYNIDRLIYYEVHSNALDAIAREKQLKSWTRRKKELLIQGFNPDWRDLSGEL